jgi:hypothetical protein
MSDLLSKVRVCWGVRGTMRALGTSLVETDGDRLRDVAEYASRLCAYAPRQAVAELRDFPLPGLESMDRLLLWAGYDLVLPVAI